MKSKLWGSRVVLLAFLASAFVVAVPASAQAAGCDTRPRVWYDSDQYGTYPKIYGVMYNCPGPKGIRVVVSCYQKAPVYDRSVNSSSLSTVSITTTVGYIGYCGAGKRWSAHVYGSYDIGKKINKYYYWYDGGNPT